MGTHVLLVGTERNDWISQIHKKEQQDLMAILRGKEMKREVKKKKSTDFVTLMTTGDERVASGDKQSGGFM